MRAKKKAPILSERQRWERTYNNLVHLLRTQQIQLETLLRERKLLERRIKTHHDRWASVARAAEDQIFQMKCDIAIEEDARSLQAVKSDLMAGLAWREAARLKLMRDYAENELAEDHKSFLDAVHQKTSQSMDPKEGGRVRSNQNKGLDSKEIVAVTDRRSEILEHELIQLRAEHDKLSLKKTAEVSALLLEKDFVWHQLKMLESDYADKLRRKTDEVGEANDKITRLIARMEELQSLNSEKDKTIMDLESKIVTMEADAGAQRNEIARANHELEALRNSVSFQSTPSLRRCSAHSRTSNLGSMNNVKVQVKKEQSDPKGSNLDTYSQKGSMGEKRKKIDVITIPDTPRLFSASFKAPKLKFSSSPAANTS